MDIQLPMEGIPVQPRPDPGPPEPIRHARVDLPEWYYHKPATIDELKQARRERDQALLEYQAAIRDFNEQHPMPPSGFRWTEYKSHGEARDRTVGPFLKRMHNAGERLQRMRIVYDRANPNESGPTTRHDQRTTRIPKLRGHRSPTRRSVPE